MDGSRDADLMNLKRVFETPTHQLVTRKRAYMGFMKIQEQRKDRQLTALRLQLIKAVRVNDHRGIKKLEKQIEDYSLRHGWQHKAYN